jgi:hypothetical protein
LTHFHILTHFSFAYLYSRTVSAKLYQIISRHSRGPNPKICVWILYIYLFLFGRNKLSLFFHVCKVNKIEIWKSRSTSNHYIYYIQYYLCPTRQITDFHGFPPKSKLKESKNSCILLSFINNKQITAFQQNYQCVEIHEYEFNIPSGRPFFTSSRSMSSGICRSNGDPYVWPWKIHLLRIYMKWIFIAIQFNPLIFELIKYFETIISIYVYIFISS